MNTFIKDNIRIIKSLDMKNTRIDEVCWYLYNDVEKSIPMVLEFNNIPSIYDINENSVLHFPDMFDYFNNLIEINDNIAGVVDTVNIGNTKNNEILLQYNKDKTIGTSKLGIVLDKIRYDKDTGIIQY